jgi:hypothetical protein
MELIDLGMPKGWRTKNPKYEQPKAGVNYDEEHKELVEAHTWCIDNHGYYRTNINKKSILLHHFLFGRPEKPLVTDHINRNRLDNRKENIRFISHRENDSNKDKTKTTSKYIGVSWCKQRNKWRSFIRINGKQEYLGLFNTEEQAHEAYQYALKGI